MGCNCGKSAKKLQDLVKQAKANPNAKVSNVVPSIPHLPMTQSKILPPLPPMTRRQARIAARNARMAARNTRIAARNTALKMMADVELEREKQAIKDAKQNPL